MTVHGIAFILTALYSFYLPSIAQDIHSGSQNISNHTSSIYQIISPQKVKEGQDLWNFAHGPGYDDHIRDLVRENWAYIKSHGNHTEVKGSTIDLDGSKIWVNNSQVMFDGEYTYYDGYKITVRDGRTIVNGTSLFVKGDHVIINGTDVQYQDGQFIVNGTNIMMCTNQSAVFQTYGYFKAHNNVLDCNKVLSWGNGTIGTYITPLTPSGQIRMIYPPAPNLIRPYFAIGSNITFKWHLENVIYPPTQLNLVIERTDIMHKYVIEYNMTGTTRSYFWSTSQINQTTTPLIQSSSYRLMIFDERGPHALEAPGRLSPFQTEFSMYISAIINGSLHDIVSSSITILPLGFLPILCVSLICFMM